MKEFEVDIFPDLDHFDYQVSIPPATTRIAAWAKLQECERRLAVFKWAEKRNDARTAQNRVLLNDCVSAFLMTFEATLQFLKNQFDRMKVNPKYNDWLPTVPENDLLVRGLCTLRHFEAHVEPKPSPRRIYLVIGESLFDGTSDSSVSCDWALQGMNAGELAKLTRPRIQSTELDDWNALVAKDDVPTLFLRGLYGLKSILEAAEKFIR